MTPRPKFERRPEGLSREWGRVWDWALRVMREQGTWAWEQRPFLDEYVLALRAAREVFDAGGPPEVWDRHVKRASRLADQLALTPRGRKAAGVGSGDKQAGAKVDPFAAFAFDELAAKRRAGRAPGSTGA